MGIIRLTLTDADVRKMVEGKIKQVERGIETSLNRVGNQFVIESREKAAQLVNIGTEKNKKFVHVHGPRMQVGENSPSYKDDTGALRSSVATITMKDGEQIHKNTQLVGGGAEGISKANALMAEIAANHKSSYTLIVVAGMEYAAAVESKGFDVLTGPSFKAVKSLDKAFKRK